MITESDIEIIELHARMNNILAEVELAIVKTGGSVPPSHPLPCLKMILYDLVMLHKERIDKSA